MDKESISGEKKIELRHESIEEILGTPPASMVRMGSGVLFVVIVLLFVSSAFFPSHIKIQLPAVLDGGLPFSVTIAPETGNIVYHHSEDNINQGDTILLIEKIDGENIPIIAEISGLLELNHLFLIHRRIEEKDTIAMIWPAERDTTVCIIRLTSERGKDVSIGHKVRIVVDDYPVEQYGKFETTVYYISHFHNEFHALAAVPFDMITTTGQYLELRGINHATVEIITDEKTVFHRLINPFRGLVKK
jgi:hypothetical protein